MAENPVARWSKKHEQADDPHRCYQLRSEKGAANGFASLGNDGKVPAGQLPASQQQQQGGASWGEVTGTLSNQTDLQTALNAKAAATHNHDLAYAPAGHHHDASYATTGHNHDGTYATAAHNHDSAYSAAAHNHAGVYEPAGTVAAHGASHAPANAQKNSDITKAEIEAKLTGEISTHTHAPNGGGGDLDSPETGSRTVATGKYHMAAKRIALTGTQRLTVLGTGRVRVFN